MLSNFYVVVFQFERGSLMFKSLNQDAEKSVILKNINIEIGYKWETTGTVNRLQCDHGMHLLYPPCCWCFDIGSLNGEKKNQKPKQTKTYHCCMLNKFLMKKNHVASNLISSGDNYTNFAILWN